MYNPRSVKKIGRREGRQEKTKGEREGGCWDRGKREREAETEIKEEETKLEFKCIKISKWQKSSQVYSKIKL